MALFPKATKTSFARLLRSKGYQLPPGRELEFSQLRHSFFLRWCDTDFKSHAAYYSAAAYRPMLLVDHEPVELTMAEVLRFGLVQEQKDRPMDSPEGHRVTMEV